MTRMRSTVLVFVGVLTAGVMRSASFAEPAPSAEKVSTAKRYVDAGIAAQQAGDFDTAIAMYTKAYDLIPKPILIFNIAQATRLAGREADAIEIYKKYLAMDPKGAQAATAQDFVNAYDAKLAAAEQEKKDAAAKAAAEQAAAAKAAADKELLEQRQAEAKARLWVEADQRQRAEQQRLREEQAARDRGGRWPVMRTAGIPVGVVGLAGLGVGIGFGLHARSLSNQLSQPGALYDPNTVSAGESANHIAIASYVVGGVFLATGVTLFALGSRHSHGDAHAVSLVPAIFSGGGGLAIAGYMR